MEKEREEKIIEHYQKVKEGKEKRNKAAPLDLKKLGEEAEKSQTKYDESWTSRESMDRLDIFGNFLKKSYCQAIKVDNFHKELELVLPCFYNDDVKKTKKTTITNSKSEEKYNLGFHLQKIKGMAFNGKPNTLNDTDISNMDTLQILETFIKADDSPHFAAVKKGVEETQMKVKGVFNIIGSEICELKRYQQKGNIGNDGDEDDGDEDEGDEEGDTLNLPSMDAGGAEAYLG